MAEDSSGRAFPLIMGVVALTLCLVFVLVAAVLTILLGSLFTPSVPEEAALTAVIDESFDTPTFLNQWTWSPGWQYVSNMFLPGMALYVYDSDAPIYPPQEIYGDVVVAARFWVSAGEARLNVRQSEAGVYTVGLTHDDTLRLYRDDEVLASSSVDTHPHGLPWNMVRLSAIGPVLRVTVDEILLITVIDPAREPLPPGTVNIQGAGDSLDLFVDSFHLWVPAEK